VKKFKGKEIEKSKHKNGNVEYDGFIDVNSNRPHGKGVCITRNENKTINRIEEGIFQNGLLTEGSETYYALHNDRSYIKKENRNFISKEIGKWRFDKDKNFCEEYISGKGDFLYYRTEKDLKNNKYFGYIKGTFDNGSLLKGEILNPSLINYTEEKLIKKIIYYDEAKPLKEFSHKNNLMRKGKMFYEIAPDVNSNRPEGQGIEYEGEIFFDQPHGKGTMTFEDGSKRTAIWDNGDTDWN